MKFDKLGIVSPGSPVDDAFMAKLLADHPQIKMRAFIQCSDYKNTWGSFEERQLGKLCGISNDAAPGEDWCRRWKKLNNERVGNHENRDFTYQTIGAINPVISGDTPFGAPGGYFEFLPK
jgi:hypothetical protein